MSNAAVTEPPASDFAPRRLRRIARRAERARRHGHGVERLAARTGLPPRQLRFLADAWAEGGRSGLDAIGPAPPRSDSDAMRRADGAIEAWRRRHYPLETLRWERWRNRVTVWQVVPPADRQAAPERRPVLQLRWTPDGRWHLYRKAAQGEWWPVPVRGRRAPQDVIDCLDAARVDVANQFWTGDEAPR
jgi:hypothetical protein